MSTDSQEFITKENILALTQLLTRLLQNNKDHAVANALRMLIKQPANLDLQINVVGNAHLANWLPNRKRIFWKVFDVTNEDWVQRCIRRNIEQQGDAVALSALLHSNATAVLGEVQRHSSVPLVIWDVAGADNCGIGLAHEQDQDYTDYFYVGWGTTGANMSINRLEYAKNAKIIRSEVVIENTIWTELPYGFGYPSTSQPLPLLNMNNTAGNTRLVWQQLMLNDGFVA